MARSKPWLKLWTEIVHDKKVRVLSNAEKWYFVAILCVGQECNAEGRLETAPGVSMSIPQIAKACEAYTRAEVTVVRHTIKVMVELGSFQWDGSTLTISHFRERQEMTPSSTREATKIRQQEHRKKLKQQSERDGHEFPVTSKAVTSRMSVARHEQSVTPVSPESPSISNNNSNIRGRGEKRDISVTREAVFESGVNIRARAIRARNYTPEAPCSDAEPKRNEFPVTAEPETAIELWNNTLSQLQREISLANYAAWFQNSKGVEMVASVLTVRVGSDYTVQHLEGTMKTLTEKVLSSVVGEPVKVRFVS